MRRNEMLGYKMRLIHNQIHRVMEAKRSENEDDLTGMQQWTIGFLKEHEGEDVYQRNLEAAFTISRATASNMLAVMERKGLIERLPVEHDARLKKLVLTEKAGSMLKQADSDVKEMERTLIQGMSEAEVQQLKDALDRILVNLGVEQQEDTGCCGFKEEDST